MSKKSHEPKPAPSGAGEGAAPIPADPEEGAAPPEKVQAMPEAAAPVQDLTLALAQAQDAARMAEPWVVDALSYDPAAAAAMNSRIDDVADGYAAPGRRENAGRETLILDGRPEGGGEPYPMFSTPNRETLKASKE